MDWKIKSPLLQRVWMVGCEMSVILDQKSILGFLRLKIDVCGAFVLQGLVCCYYEK
jgi:hypothetical protein